MEFFASVTAEEEAAKTRLDLIRIHASGVLQVSISLGVTFKLVVVVFVSAKNISISCLGFHKEPPHADIDFAGKGLRILQLGMKNKTLFEQQSHSRHETIIAIFLCGSKALTPNNILGLAQQSGSRVQGHGGLVRRSISERDGIDRRNVATDAQRRGGQGTAGRRDRDLPGGFPHSSRQTRRPVADAAPKTRGRGRRPRSRRRSPVYRQTIEPS